jgi:tRNA nucleotidyltransferase/poly(A) polymerase
MMAAAGIKTVPTGVDHGTLTAIVEGRGYEVTTLREDVETDGRHAVVRFGRDWRADALRRDFTVNALSVDAGGTVHDPVGGYRDVLDRHIRFIGDPDRRIAEDRLRILRFFRFHAEYGAGDIDRAGLAAAIRGRDGLRLLSAERIGNEMRRLVIAPRAVETTAVIQEAGVLTVVLGGIGYLGAFARLVAVEAALGVTPDPALRLAGLGCRIEEDALRLTERLRLANIERDRMLAAIAAARRLVPLPDARSARRLLYALGEAAWRDGVRLAFAAGAGSIGDSPWRDLHDLPDRWPVPRFPLSGRDVVGGGTVSRGPAVGGLLRALEAWWIEQDFAPDEAFLRRRLQQMISDQQ